MTQSQKQALWVLAIVAAAALLLFISNTFKPAPVAKPPAQVARIPVEVTVTERQDFQVQLPSQALVKAVTESRLAAQVAGRVVSKNPNFELGGSFQKGDLLLTIEDADYVASAKLAEANLNQAQVALQEEQARSEQAARDWQRLSQSSEPSDLVLRKPQLETAKANLEAAAAQLEQAQLDLSRTKVLAPYDGRVVGNAIDEGNYVNRGQVLGDIVAAGMLQVDLPISASWRHLLDWSGENNSVKLSLANNSVPVQWQAQILRATADVTSDSRQFRVVARIDVDSASDPSVALFIGDYVNAQIAGTTLSGVFVVPQLALYDDKFVWLVDDDKIYKREVDVVWSDDDYAVINQGLAAGEQVVITALGPVVSGTPVRIVESDGEVESELPELADTNVIAAGQNDD